MCAPQAGPNGLEAFLLPCLEEALHDGEDGIVAAAIGFLTATARSPRLLRKQRLLQVSPPLMVTL